MTNGRCTVAGHELFAGTMDDAVVAIDALRRRGGLHLVVTLNVDQILTLERDPQANEATARASIRTIDGAPVLAVAKLLGARNVHRITGADLIEAVSQSAAGRGWRVAVVGGAPGVAEHAVARLSARSGADLHAVAAPLFDDRGHDPADATIRALTSLAPDVVFVCFGAPKQELWVAQWRDRLPPAVYIGAGAAVDFAAGTRLRAPRVVQRIGGEWLWRLAQEPRRLVWRYLVRGPRFVLIAARSIAQGLQRGGVGGRSREEPHARRGLSDDRQGEAGPRASSIAGHEAHRGVRDAEASRPR
ncbi:WecB/TagA/CpsF family glycosyltransferase [Curtobacterium ammoniigenes]|uniref:WecB/TagA/CpsF family glycosyltransferase n=1 Tax=Curtobacterium ammoniigenes TaxID=395387 RepID=UPI0012EEAF8C|nr:WecB/TagA/CpsF family glycosyltransferase [Curtobacterium ammoniigenes]